MYKKERKKRKKGNEERGSDAVHTCRPNDSKALQELILLM